MGCPYLERAGTAGHSRTPSSEAWAAPGGHGRGEQPCPQPLRLPRSILALTYAALLPPSSRTAAPLPPLLYTGQRGPTGSINSCPTPGQRTAALSPGAASPLGQLRPARSPAGIGAGGAGAGAGAGLAGEQQRPAALCSRTWCPAASSSQGPAPGTAPSPAHPPRALLGARRHRRALRQPFGSRTAFPGLPNSATGST